MWHEKFDYVALVKVFKKRKRKILHSDTSNIAWDTSTCHSMPIMETEDINILLSSIKCPKRFFQRTFVMKCIYFIVKSLIFYYYTYSDLLQSKVGKYFIANFLFTCRCTFSNFCGRKCVLIQLEIGFNDLIINWK